MRSPVAAICANTTCNAELREGKSALYDDYNDKHFCGKGCYNDWWDAYTDVLKQEYFLLNVENVDL